MTATGLGTPAGMLNGGSWTSPVADQGERCRYFLIRQGTDLDFDAVLGNVRQRYIPSAFDPQIVAVEASELRTPSCPPSTRSVSGCRHLSL